MCHGSATPTKVVIWSMVPDVVNHVKYHQNLLRSFDSLRGQNLFFFHFFPTYKNGSHCTWLPLYMAAIFVIKNG